ncbi:MAG: MATE family efflux transporter [Spirochaetaceae bacterium]|nr:MATE family efflux transporter [Spirochaetaceae bacterium]MCF7947234.1 MATE family efflux transporter [Spirochaetia bacterium]MCF7950273.1 MATE family efflux transporter [Spirochaetaceae bacterium]
MQAHRSSNRLGTEPVFSLLVKLSIPGVIGMATQALYNVVDSIYIGHVSKEALSALSLAFPLQMVLIALAVGTGVGATSLISRTLGSGDHQKAGIIADHVVLIAAILGATVALIGWLFSHNLISLFTHDPLLIKMGGDYIRIIMVGSIALFVPMLFNGILRGEGNTFIPMLTMMIGAILNITIDPLLIFGFWIFPEMGVEGAALATVLSRIISGTFVILILFSDKNEIKMNLRTFRFSFMIIREIYRVGLPAMAMQLLASVMLAGGNLIIGRHSITAIAVFGIFFRLQSFIFMPVFGLGQGVMPLIGYNYGNRNPDRMKQTARIGITTAFCFTFIGFLIFQSIPRQLITMFNSDPELVRIGVTAMRRISIGFLFVGPSIMSANIFQAIGRGSPSLLIGILRTIGILLPSMYILGEFFGLSALWFAFPIAEVITFSLAFAWLISALKQIFKSMKQ